ncbi:hypothetical protein BB559_004429 [Furculomyces boomerangus]|uniref:Enoyl-CoA hydratase n=1 Tax=Furculomyces boomerangus TaxID=61424 RepID=A0A2T9YES0_9FUNG|nr:hypothetical protein BB559_004429 [Furculomyces boomerangus]
MTTELYFPNSQNPLIKLHTPFPGKPTHFVVQMVSLPENRVTIALVDAFTAALDHIDNIYDNLSEADKDIGGCVITTSTGKFFSNGLDQQHSLGNPAFNKKFTPFLTRLLGFRLPTIAAVNGHAFAGGCMIACAHDYIIMGSQRGYICMNEMLINVPLNSGTQNLIRTRVTSPRILNQIILEARRFTADQAVEAGFVDQAVPNDKVFESAGKLADTLSHLPINRGLTFGLMKAEKNKTAIVTMMEKDAKPGSFLSKL